MPRHVCPSAIATPHPRALPVDRPRPFVKWVGGKTQLLPELVPRVLRARPFNLYHEPFLGGGALFFGLARIGMLPHGARLSDINSDLVSAYCAVRDDVEGVIRVLSRHAGRHSSEYYYHTRVMKPTSQVELGAWLIYLNRTGYNGLFRVNRRGEFNVPLGSYTNPRICDADGLRAASDALQGTHLEVSPFEAVCACCSAGDLVYFDPPYVPLSRTASFTSYSSAGFGDAEQERLAMTFTALHRAGAKVILSNSDMPLVRKLYKDFRTGRVRARRAVNSKGDRRGAVTEVIIQNF